MEVRNLQKWFPEEHEKLTTVKKSEISQILLDFAKPAVQKNFLLLNGQPLKADEAVDTKLVLSSLSEKNIIIYLHKYIILV